MSGAKLHKTLLARLMEHPLARIGPGLITGVADDDPSGICSANGTGLRRFIERNLRPHGSARTGPGAFVGKGQHNVSVPVQR